MKKRCNRFRELSVKVREMLIQEYLEKIKDEKIARLFGMDYYTGLGSNFNEDGSMSDPY